MIEVKDESGNKIAEMNTPEEKVWKDTLDKMEEDIVQLERDIIVAKTIRDLCKKQLEKIKS